MSSTNPYNNNISSKKLNEEINIQFETGWSPELAVVADGTRRVLKLDAWIGGSGTPPNDPAVINYYLGTTGFTSVIANATQIGDMNVYTQTELQTSGSASVHWDNITNTPTTPDGYGIVTPSYSSPHGGFVNGWAGLFGACKLMDDVYSFNIALDKQTASSNLATTITTAGIIPSSNYVIPAINANNTADATATTTMLLIASDGSVVIPNYAALTKRYIYASYTVRTP
jgi:hypothetical protein